MQLLARLALIGILALSACRASEPGNQAQPQAAETAIAPILTTPDAVDTHSFAKPLEARVTHVALDLTVDFDTKRMSGTATLDIDRTPDAKEIVLDDAGLEIQSVTDGSKHPLPFKVGVKDPNLGSPLTIGLPPDTRRPIITYKSAP